MDPLPRPVSLLRCAGEEGPHMQMEWPLLIHNFTTPEKQKNGMSYGEQGTEEMPRRNIKCEK